MSKFQRRFESALFELTKFHEQTSISSILKNSQIYKTNEDKALSLSIVCTAHNRELQTYFTLAGWDELAAHHQTCFQFIVVEDTPQPGKRLKPEKLKEYKNLQIIHVIIKSKNWINPCLNYNIAFSFIRSDIVVITNAEVRVFGDIYTAIKSCLTKQNYLVFDVVETGWLHNTDNQNKRVWKEAQTYEDMLKILNGSQINWLHHHSMRKKNYHFLSCIHRDNLTKMGGFDPDFALGTWYDDDFFVYQIKHVLKLEIVGSPNEKLKILGFHQHHESVKSVNFPGGREKNKSLMELKIRYHQLFGKYLQFSKNDWTAEEINQL